MSFYPKQDGFPEVEQPTDDHRIQMPPEVQAEEDRRNRQIRKRRNCIIFAGILITLCIIAKIIGPIIYVLYYNFTK